MAIPILTISQMREWEQATWDAGRSESDVIAKVGVVLARRALGLTQTDQTILILAGKGHNGDDARAAVTHLSKRQVRLINVADAQSALAEMQIQLEGVSLIIDGLFGIGINRPLNEEWQRLIEAVNQSRIPVLSVDAPSGLDVDTGEVQGAAVRAWVTLRVGAPKHGLRTATAQQRVGRLEVAEDVGLIPCPITSEMRWISAGDFFEFPPQREVTGHKGTYGHLTIIAGRLGYHGAAVLAARGALRARPGLVSVVTQENVFHPVAAQLQAAMVHPWRPQQKLPAATTAILFGPGLAAEGLSNVLKNELRGFWNESALPVVADASALDWLPSGPIPKNPLRVITPHPGEAARLLKLTVNQVQEDRPAALRTLSRRYGNCWVVLKGHQTLIGRNGGPIWINSSGNPYLAQGGSGDVLAGYLAGLLAQPQLTSTPERTLIFAAWQHGASADFLNRNQKNWTIEELVQALAAQPEASGKQNYFP